MKKILHIFPDSLFIESYLEMLENDKVNKHQFILTDIGANINLDTKKYKKYKFDKISTFKITDAFKMNIYLKKYNYDLLIVHSGYLNFLLLSFLINKKILKKTILSLWGGSDSKKFEVKERNIIYKVLGKIYEILRKKVYKNIKIFASIVPDDYERIKSLYNLNSKHFTSEYPFVSNILDNIKKDYNKEIKIQICHSGSQECNTLEVLDYLSKYKNENILVCASLGYGNESYIKKVEEKGKKIFKDKFIANYDIVPIQQYAKYISNLDILINNSEVQQGLGNLRLAMISGVKIYLNPKGKLYTSFTEEKVNIYNVKTIPKITFEEFLYFDQNKKENNFNKGIIYFDSKKALKLWEIIFKNEL